MKNEIFPNRHHYIPAFYLKRWAGADGRLCQFTKPHTSVVPNRRHPNQTGLLANLYAIRGLAGAQSARYETRFFKPVDSKAATALQMMETQGNSVDWDSDLRSAWTRFLHSLLLRCPEDLEMFYSLWGHTLRNNNEDWEERYQRERDPSSPPSLAEYLASRPIQETSANTLKALVSLIDNQGVGVNINNMLWWVRETPNSKHELLTSDRPIIRTNGLRKDGGHLVMAIGPRRMFIAAHDEKALTYILSMRDDLMVKTYNKLVASGCAKLVYGTDDKQLPFVSKHFSTEPQPRLIEGMLRKHGQPVS